MLSCTNIKQPLICGISKLLLLHIHSIKKGFHNSFFCLPEIDKGQQFASRNIQIPQQEKTSRLNSREENDVALNRMNKLKKMSFTLI